VVADGEGDAGTCGPDRPTVGRFTVTRRFGRNRFSPERKYARFRPDEVIANAYTPGRRITELTLNVTIVVCRLGCTTATTRPTRGARDPVSEPSDQLLDTVDSRTVDGRRRPSRTRDTVAVRTEPGSAETRNLRYDTMWLRPWLPDTRLDRYPVWVCGRRLEVYASSLGAKFITRVGVAA
jgi:hypothetical protein